MILLVSITIAVHVKMLCGLNNYGVQVYSDNSNLSDYEDLIQCMESTAIVEMPY